RGGQVGDAAGLADAGPPREGVDRGQTAVVILVELEEVVRGRHAGAPLAAEGRQHAGLADRMLVVVLPYAPGGALKHFRGYGKSKPVSSHLSAREDNGYRRPGRSRGHRRIDVGYLFHRWARGTARLSRLRRQ